MNPSLIYPDFKPLNKPGQPLKDALRKNKRRIPTDPLYRVVAEMKDGSIRAITPAFPKATADGLIEACNIGIIKGTNQVFSNPHLVRVR